MNKRLISFLLAAALPMAANAGAVSPQPAPEMLPPPPPHEAEFGKHHGKNMEKVAQELGLN